MLINAAEQVTQHVEFVSYSGKYPNLCCGKLILNIDGKDVSFGKDSEHEKFWSTGGNCLGPRAATGEWYIDVEKIPEEFRKYASEIDNVFNVNVEYGCCGGCY